MSTPEVTATSAPAGTVRARFCPSPTGTPHVGLIRTALYNWAFARHHEGTLVFRIEDTDASRDSQESYEALLEALRWLGLDWDEGPEVGGEHGPYRQSERRDIYTDIAQRLLDAGDDETAADDRLDDLDAILAAPDVRSWASRFLRPLLRTSPGVHDTVRVWVEHGTHLESTASALGISVPAVRKRLHRAEEALERSLLRSPSACYDLHFAFRADAQRS